MNKYRLKTLASIFHYSSVNKPVITIYIVKLLKVSVYKKRGGGDSLRNGFSWFSVTAYV